MLIPHPAVAFEIERLPVLPDVEDEGDVFSCESDDHFVRMDEVVHQCLLSEYRKVEREKIGLPKPYHLRSLDEEPTDERVPGLRDLAAHGMFPALSLSYSETKVGTQVLRVLEAVERFDFVPEGESGDGADAGNGFQSFDDAVVLTLQSDASVAIRNTFGEESQRVIKIRPQQFLNVGEIGHLSGVGIGVMVPLQRGELPFDARPLSDEIVPMLDQLPAIPRILAGLMDRQSGNAAVEESGTENLRVDLVVLDTGSLDPCRGLPRIERYEGYHGNVVQCFTEEMPAIGSFAGNHLLAGEAKEHLGQLVVLELLPLEYRSSWLLAINHADRRCFLVKVEADDVVGSIDCLLELLRSGKVFLEDRRGHEMRGKECPSVYGHDHGHFADHRQ